MSAIHLGSLRHTARPVDFDSFTKSQCNAAIRLVQALVESLSAIDGRLQTRMSPSAIDRDRRTQLLFWTGDAGVGKTSAYLSLREWFQDPLVPIPDETGRPESHRGLFALLRDVHHLRNRVRWLEVLDLDPLAGKPNFLAAVAARISLALDLDGHAADGAVDWLVPGGTDFSKAVQEFQALRNNIALSWEGNLPVRGDTLEPDVYAAEVMRAETARLRVERDFREILDKLAAAGRSSSRRDSPLFVLPVDDFYLKPDVTIEILRFLRMISSQRLFILMMGQVDVVEDLMFWHSLGEATRLMGPGGTAMLPQRLRSKVVGRAMSIARTIQHKLIPMNQQVTVDSMDDGETRDFGKQASQSPSPSEDRYCSIEELLDRVKPASGVSLLSLFGHDRDKAPWFSKDALTISPRHAADFHQQLVRALETATDSQGEGSDGEKRIPPNVIVEIVWHQVDRVLFETPLLKPQDAETIADQMISRVDVDQRIFPKACIVEEDSNAKRLVITFRRQHANARRATTRRPQASVQPLPPLVQAWLALLHDTLATYGDPQDAPNVIPSDLHARTFGEFARKGNGPKRSATARGRRNISK